MKAVRLLYALWTTPPGVVYAAGWGPSPARAQSQRQHPDRALLARVAAGRTRPVCDDHLSVRARVCHDFGVRGAVVSHHVLRHVRTNMKFSPTEWTIVVEARRSVAIARLDHAEDALAADAIRAARRLARVASLAPGDVAGR